MRIIREGLNAKRNMEKPFVNFSINKVSALLIACAFLFGIIFAANPFSSLAATDSNREIIKGRTYAFGDDTANFMIIRYDDRYVLVLEFETNEDWKTAISFMKANTNISNNYVYVPYHLIISETVGTNIGLVYGDYPQEYAFGIANDKEIDLSDWVTNRLYEMPSQDGAIFVTWIDESMADFKEVIEKNPTQKDIGPGFAYNDDSDVEKYGENKANGEYIIENSDSEYIEKSYLELLTDEELRLARNEIYARHGRGFSNQELQAYFSSKSWYIKLYEPDEFDKIQNSVLNDYEKKNRDLIVQVEEERKAGKKQ